MHTPSVQWQLNLKHSQTKGAASKSAAIILDYVCALLLRLFYAKRCVKRKGKEAPLTS